MRIERSGPSYSLIITVHFFIISTFRKLHWPCITAFMQLQRHAVRENIVSLHAVRSRMKVVNS